MKQNNIENIDCLIIGAGLAGLSTAYHLKCKSIILEKETKNGGSASTLYYKDFKLDKSVHILYFRNNYTHELIADKLGVKLIKKNRDSRVYFNSKEIPFPLQYNLNELPFSIKIKLASVFLSKYLFNGAKHQPINFEEWAIKYFGKDLYKIFFKPYNEKLWGVPLTELTPDWMDELIPKVSIKLILKGLKKSNKQAYGFNSNFYYPENGGINEVAKAFQLKNQNINNSSEIETIDHTKKLVHLNNGDIYCYKFLINTSPLKNFIKYLDLHDNLILNFASKLKANSTTVAHVLINQTKSDSGLHWLYVADADKNFYRITFPHNINERNCPPGNYALTVEFGGTIKDKISEEAIMIKQLIEMKLLNKKTNYEILWEEIPTSYVIYNNEMVESRNKIHEYLNKKNIFSIGRYGRWEYSNMESAILQGRETAELINEMNK